jgi:hypothetical protein
MPSPMMRVRPFESRAEVEHRHGLTGLRLTFVGGSEYSRADFVLSVLEYRYRPVQTRIGII